MFSLKVAVAVAVAELSSILKLVCLCLLPEVAVVSCAIPSDLLIHVNVYILTWLR